jgi:GMP synthase-like glutamine amidotransferase
VSLCQLIITSPRAHKEIAWNLGGTVAKCDHREYGSARVQINKFGTGGTSSVDALFEGLGDEMEVRLPMFTPELN